MKHDKKKTFENKALPSAEAAVIREILAQAWKPEVSSLKREDWRRIVMERLG